MSLISGFANQSVTLRRRTGVDSYEGNTYASPETIRARYEPRTGLTRSLGGDEVAVTSYVLTEEAIALGDQVEGSEVKRVDTIVDKGGRVLGYEVYL